jgi:stage V sporulation protein G
MAYESPIKITEISIRKPQYPDSRLLAFVTVIFENSFAVTDLRLLQLKDGPFLAMPSKKASTPCGKCKRKNTFDCRYCGKCGQLLEFKEEEHFDVSFPINNDFRKFMLESILSAYREKPNA